MDGSFQGSEEPFLQADGLTIAVDFDGTIVEHEYPRIGKEMLFAFDTLKALRKKGHKLILWTFREGDSLDEAVQFCRENGVEFYAVNKNYPEERYDEMSSRKVLADVYIDDRNLGGFPGWSKVWQTLHPDSGELDHQLTDPAAHYNYKELGFWQRVKKVFRP
jgi:hydroxymethylpyrimidine pyrophosphatase-like HAD family hydrolase